MRTRPYLRFGALVLASGAFATPAEAQAVAPVQCAYIAESGLRATPAEHARYQSQVLACIHAHLASLAPAPTAKLDPFISGRPAATDAGRDGKYTSANERLAHHSDSEAPNETIDGTGLLHPTVADGHWWVAVWRFAENGDVGARIMRVTFVQGVIEGFDTSLGGELRPFDVYAPTRAQTFESDLSMDQTLTKIDGFPPKLAT
jgi:hypothetical protein